MIIQIEGGLFSRLDVLASIVSSKHYPSLIQPVWNRNEGVNAHFHLLFENDIYFADYIPCEKEYYQPGTHLDPRINDKYIIADHPVLFEDTAKYGEFFSHSNFHPFSNFIRQLKPVKEIRDEIEQILESNKDFDFYGFNIRRGMGLNYHPNSVIYSPIKLFIDKAKQIFDDFYKNRIVVTTDSYETLENLCIDFYDKLIFIKDYMKYPLNDGYNLAGMKRSVIDWFLLTKCKKIYCSKEAGFAIRAARTANIEYEELISQDQKIINYYAAAIERKQRGIF